MYWGCCCGCIPGKTPNIRKPVSQKIRCRSKHFDVTHTRPIFATKGMLPLCLYTQVTMRASYPPPGLASCGWKKRTIFKYWRETNTKRHYCGVQHSPRHTICSQSLVHVLHTAWFYYGLWLTTLVTRTRWWVPLSSNKYNFLSSLVRQAPKRGASSYWQEYATRRRRSKQDKQGVKNTCWRNLLWSFRKDKRLV